MGTFDHSALQLFLGTVLFQFLAAHPLGRVLPEFRCIFGPAGRERAYVPDVCYVARARLTGDKYLRAAPDLTIEILSPDQPMTHFLDKIQFYLLYGVRLVWVVDPGTSTSTVQVPDHEAQVLSLGDVLDGGDVLPGLSVKVDEIFAQMQI
jgi:Uma2 family endonuclease